jgi:Zn-dependent protease/predicted transcriptional regulator
MNANISLGKIWGIPLGLNASWFVIFLLSTFSLSTGYFPIQYPELGLAGSVVLGLITTLLLFGSVLAHELGHAYLALRNNIPVKGITLFIFGGVAQISSEPKTPGAEFRIAIAGPLVSVALAALFGGLYLIEAGVPYLAAPAFYLMRINLILTLFNLIPGFPLDGGRVLRAIIWKLSGSYVRATKYASIGGQVVAFGFIGLGIFQVFTGQVINGLWLGLIGWFLQNAAGSAYAQMNIQQSLRGVTVSQAMQQDSVQVPALTPVSYLVEGYVLNNGRTNFLVEEDGQVRGILTLQEIMAVPQTRWRYTTAGQIMVPLARTVQVDSESELLMALEKMENANLSHVSVIEHENLVGILSRDQMSRYLRLRSELGV